MFLVIDTETTGKPRYYDAPPEVVDNWPRIVQLAWQLFDDGAGLVDQHSCIVRPDGWEVPEEAARIHGITTDRAAAEGIPIGDALNRLKSAVAKARYLVAHNLSFDLPVVAAEFVRFEGTHPLSSLERICTMRAGTNVCKLLGPRGFKWPRLEELHTHLFGEAPAQQHDAMADVVSCAKSFFEMRKRGLLPNLLISTE